jgi:hypothetical protein
MSIDFTPELRTLLTAGIAVGSSRAFAVELDTAGAPLPEEECFRFALHYYARVLRELSGRHAVDRLPSWIARIAQTDLDRDADLFAIAGADGTLVRSLDDPAATFQVSMRTAGVRDREIAGELPAIAPPALARTVLAVCQAVLPHLSDGVRTAVPAALANMNASYEMTHRYGDPHSEREVPAIAYLAASFV